MKRSIILGPMMICGCVSDPWPFETSKLPQTMSGRALCEVTANTYFAALDQGDADRFAGVFTEDAVLVLPNMEFQGREEITGFAKNRSANIALTHHLTTFDFRPSGRAQANGTVYALISAERRLDDGTASQGIAERFYSDTYTVSVDSCKIARRELKVGATHVTGSLPSPDTP